jgi:hypothetical protein
VLKKLSGSEMLCSMSTYIGPSFDGNRRGGPSIPHRRAAFVKLGGERWPWTRLSRSLAVDTCRQLVGTVASRPGDGSRFST